MIGNVLIYVHCSRKEGSVMQIIIALFTNVPRSQSYGETDFEISVKILRSTQLVFLSAA